MADVTFISSLLTTSPYPNIKMFKEGFIPAGYIYTDSVNYKASEDNTFLYCCDQDERDPEGQTTLAIYYDDPGGNPDVEGYTEYANDHPAFYRGRYEFEGDTFDQWDMYEGSECIMTFFTHIITTSPVVEGSRGTIDLTQYCPIYEDLLKTAFETGKFPNTTYFNTQAQIVGPDNTVPSRNPYVMSTPGDIDGLNPDYLVFVQGDNIAGAGANSEFTSSRTSSWGNKTVLVHPGRAYISGTMGDMEVDPSIFTTWICQTNSISSTSAFYYFPIVDIDSINNGHNDDHGIVRVIRPQISIPLHTPTCIFWGKTRYKGRDFIVPVAVVRWASGGGSVTARTLIDWKSYLLTLSY